MRWSSRRVENSSGRGRGMWGEGCGHNPAWNPHPTSPASGGGATSSLSRDLGTLDRSLPLQGEQGGGRQTRPLPIYPPYPRPLRIVHTPPHLFRAGRPAATSGGRTAGQGEVALSLGSLGGPLRSGEVR